jgi:hypothetical protein
VVPFKNVISNYTDHVFGVLPVDSRFTIEKCPSCMNGKIESMPLSDNEIFKFCHEEIRGVTLEFTSNR